jgi:hypothetical protein
MQGKYKLILIIIYNDLKIIINSVKDMCLKFVKSDYNG